MRTRTNRNNAALLAALAMALGCAGSANAFVVDTCVVAAAGCTVGVTPTQGWDGPGLGTFSLGYYIGNAGRADLGLGGMSVAVLENAFAAAAATWASVVQVTFVKLGDAVNGATGAFANNSIDFYFHGSGADAADGIGFDGAWNPGNSTGSVFAHAWGPKDIMTEITAGNMHFDKDEHWVTSGALIGANSATIDLQSVILHELGHVLGLGHENSLGTGINGPVMQSLYWGEKRALTADDIAGVQSLYCPTGQICNGNGNGHGVPEPGTLLLLGLSLFGWMSLSRRRAQP
jgi:hypothetical protein